MRGIIGCNKGLESRNSLLYNTNMISNLKHPTSTVTIAEFTEGSSGSEVDAMDIKKKFQLLYDYNVLLREKLLDIQSLLNALAPKASSSSSTAEHGA